SDSSDGQSEKCPICLRNFTTQEVGTPEACDHSFCADCLQEWSRNVNTCPVDRQVFTLILVRRSLEGKVVRRIPVEPPRQQSEDEVQEDPTYCEVCGECDREDRMLLCDGCDLGYHLECLDPPMDTVPLEEWFCPDCVLSNSVNLAEEVDIQDGELTALLEDAPVWGLPPLRPRVSRLLPRTRQSERVRATMITRQRQQSEGRQQIDQTQPSTSSGIDSLEADSSASVGSIRQRLLTNTTKPAHKHRKTTKRGTTRRRKKRRKASGAKKSKRTTSSTKGTLNETSKRKQKKRRKVKRKKRKAISRRARRPARIAVPHSVKGRLAEHLGVCPPRRPGQTIPDVRPRVTSTRIDFQRSRAGIPTLHLFGQRDQLDYFSSGSVSSIRSATGNLLSDTGGRLSDEPSCDLVGSILNSQAVWHSKKSVVTINRDGSLHIKSDEGGGTLRRNTEKSALSDSGVNRIEEGLIVRTDDKLSQISSSEVPVNVTEAGSSASGHVTQAPMYPGRSGSSSTRPPSGGGFQQFGSNRYSNSPSYHSYLSGRGYSHFPPSSSFDSRGSRTGYVNYLNSGPLPPFRSTPLRFRMSPRYPRRPLMPIIRPQFHQQQIQQIPPSNVEEFQAEDGGSESQKHHSSRPDEEEDEIDIYSDIEVGGGSGSGGPGGGGSEPDDGDRSVELGYEALPPPPIPPAMLMGMGGDAMSDEEPGSDSELVIDDNIAPSSPPDSSDRYDPEEATAKPEIPDVSQAVQDVLKDHLTEASSIVRRELGVIADERSERHSSVDEEEEGEECPNFSIYSATSMDIARRTGDDDDDDDDIPIPKVSTNFEMAEDTKIDSDIEKENKSSPGDDKDENSNLSIGEELISHRGKCESFDLEGKKSKSNAKPKDGELSNKRPEITVVGGEGHKNCVVRKMADEIREPEASEELKKLSLVEEIFGSDDNDSLIGGVTSAVTVNIAPQATVTPLGLEGLDTETISETEEAINFEDDLSQDDGFLTAEEDGEIPSVKRKKKKKNRKPSLGGSAGEEASSAKDQTLQDIIDYEEGEIVDDRPKQHESLKKDKKISEKKEKLKYEDIQRIDENFDVTAKSKIVTSEEEKKKKKKKSSGDKARTSKEKTLLSISENKEKNKDKSNKADESSIAWKKLSKSSKERNYRDPKSKPDADSSKVKEVGKKKDTAGKDGAGKKEKKKKEKRKDMERYDVRKIVTDKKRKRRDAFGRDLSRERSYTKSRSRSRGRSYDRSRGRSRSISRSRVTRSKGRSPLKSRIRSRSRSRLCSRSRSRIRSRSRSKTRSKVKSKERLRKSRSKEKQRPRVSRSRSRGRRTRSWSRSRSRNRSHLRSRSRSPVRSRDRRDRSRERRGSERCRYRDRRSWSHSWTPSWSRSHSLSCSSYSQSRTPTPRRFNRSYSRSFTRSWSREQHERIPVIEKKSGAISKTAKKLTVIVPNTKDDSERHRKKEKKRKESKKNKDAVAPLEKRKKRKEKSPAPSKEVFTSGDNILVSVNFKSNKTTGSKDVLTTSGAVAVAVKDPSKRKQIDGPFEMDRESTKKLRKDKGGDKTVVRSGEKKSKKGVQKAGNKASRVAALINKKPVAIIDLDQSPFHEQTPSPRDLIVLSDSEEDHITKEGNREELADSLSSRRKMLHKGPNTPPEPRGPTTPCSPPTSPDAYDPFDPTKSGTPSPVGACASMDGPPSPSHTPTEQLIQHSVIDQESPVVSDIEDLASKSLEARVTTPTIASAEEAADQSSQSPERAKLSVRGDMASSPSIVPEAACLPPPVSSDNEMSQPSEMAEGSEKSKQISVNLPPSGPSITSTDPNTIQSPECTRTTPERLVPPLSKLPPVRSTTVQNGEQTQTSQKQPQDTTTDVVDMDLESPYSPGSSEGDDLFDPPADIKSSGTGSSFTAMSNERNRTLPQPAKSSNKLPLPLAAVLHKSPSKPPTTQDKFDSVFGLSPLRANKMTPARATGRSAAKVLHVKGCKKEIAIKMDEDQLQILDDLPSSAVELQVKDKFLKKLNRQERVVEEVKLSLKPHYTKKHITKEEYKDILRRSVPKVS
ncbi:hypothetical protein L798_05321, partial [Zootermopsis nevadensis]